MAIIYPLLRSCVLKNRSVILVKTQGNAGVYEENTSLFHLMGAAMFSQDFECQNFIETRSLKREDF